MESEKRKRKVNVVFDGRRTKAREDDGEQKKTTEAEVEEFFAIIRRLHSSVRHGKSDNGDGRKLTEKGSSWKPAFEWGDFEEANGVRNRGRRREDGVEENLVFDLNVDPNSDTNSV